VISGNYGNLKLKTKEIKKKIDFFQDLSRIYWGIPNAFFVPGKKQ
jgi:hypothetical protein